MTDTNSVRGNGPTDLDLQRAQIYALDVVQRLRCQDKTIQKQYGNNLFFVEKDDMRLYPCPTGPTGSLTYDCAHGNCAMGENLCKAQSENPYDADGAPVSPKPTKPYLEWHPDPSHPAGGKCVWGNSPLMQWCKYPPYRRTESVRGVTDVPPFEYKSDLGTCWITKPYCDWMEVSYKEQDDGVPTCYLSGAQKFFEKYVLGTKHVTKVIDQKMMKSYKKIGPDFGGSGVHLYTITWKDEAVKHDLNAYGGTVGFLAKEIKKKYPQLIIRRDGLDWIDIDVEDAKKDKYIKRIYLVSTSGGWVLETLTSLLNQAQNMKAKKD
jgi:hypothetical protein